MGGIDFGGSTVVVTTVTGSVPTGGADTSAPVKIGGKALSAAPAAAAPSTIVDAYFDRYGRLVVYHDQALPVGTNEIGGVNLTKISGTAAAVGAGAANAGTQRVVIADDDANVSGILSRLDITLSALRDSLLGAGGKDLSTLETDVEAILSHLDEDAVLLDAVKTAVEGTLNTSLQTALPAGTNEIGGVNISKVAGTAVSVNSGNLDAGVQRVAIATDDVNLSAIKAAVEKIDDLQDATAAEAAAATKGIQISLDNGTTTTFAQCDANGSLKIVQCGVPVKTAATGSGAIAISYAPSAAFWLDAITIHLSAAPTTAGDLTVTLDAADGAAYDTVLFSLDPSEQSDTDVVYIPDQPLLCVSGDAIAVAYPNTDGRTYGLRIIARLA